MTLSYVSVFMPSLFVVSDSLMEPYRKFLHTYLSLSGPHLGYLYSTNSLFNSGLWLLKKLKSTQVIHQLTLTDDPDLRHTFFYKLCKVRKKKHLNLSSDSPMICRNISLLFGSKIGLNYFFQQKTLENFKNIILLSSPQVCFHVLKLDCVKQNWHFFSTIMWLLCNVGRLCSISLSKNRIMPTSFFRQLEKGSSLLGNAE